jgi:CDP-diacylglycerol--serine O-phosphatidyltransferase
VYRYYWLARHPEAWSVPSRERRAIRRAGSAARRFGLRPPLRRRVAGAASRISQVRLPRRTDPPVNGNGNSNGAGGRRRGWRQLGLRRQERR